MEPQALFDGVWDARGIGTECVLECLVARELEDEGAQPRRSCVVAAQHQGHEEADDRGLVELLVAYAGIHGARAAMPHLAAKPNQLGAWLQNMLTRAHPNVVVVALAAKLARIAWAVLRHEEDFDPRTPVVV